MSGGVPIHACYMASGFPPIAATNGWLHSVPSPHILAMACDI